MAAHEARPALCSEGHALVATHFPPETGGTPVVMDNLLSCFDPRSFTVATVRTSGAEKLPRRHELDVRSVMSSYVALRRLDLRWMDAQIAVAAARMVVLMRRLQPRVLLAVYPHYHLFAAARVAARIQSLPWVAYLQDTMAEALARGRFAQRGASLEQAVFREASRVLVMSRGMQELYRAKHMLDCEPLEHVYPEPVPPEPPRAPGARQAFLSGSIYQINARAVGRVSRALEAEGIPFHLTAAPGVAAGAGIAGPHLRFGFHASRREYLEVLSRQGLLVLALDGPDESPVHEAELSTIFPTKTPDYLAAGRPILAHCPEHYFLARFVRDNGCGVVVSDRSVASLREAARSLLEGGQRTRDLCSAALRAARLFSPDRVAPRVRGALDAAVRARRPGTEPQ